MTDSPALDTPAVGRPQLSAVRSGLERSLADLLYFVGTELLHASRTVERHHVEAFLPQADKLATNFAQILLLHGQLASLDELAGGRLHGTQAAVFPPADAQTQERIAAFQASRALERTQQRPWVEVDDEPDEGA